MKNENNRHSFIEVIITLSTEGKEVASKLYSQQYFFMAETPKFMKEFGLSGDSFTIAYGTISRHFGKDPDHSLNIDIWKRLPEAIVNPFAITEYYKEKEHKQKRGYRLYTSISLNDGFVVAGIDVKIAGRNLLINSISTVFAKNGQITAFEKEIFRDTKNNPQQAALLKRPNSSQYPSIGDSDCKDTSNY